MRSVWKSLICGIALTVSACSAFAAANHGIFLTAEERLGLRMQNNEPVVERLTKAMKRGDKKAAYPLSYALRNYRPAIAAGESYEAFQKRLDQAFASADGVLKNAADAGDLRAQLEYARYLDRMGDPLAATELIAKAMKKGSLRAKTEYAQRLNKGAGVTADSPRAFALLKEAAGAGEVHAQTLLGLHYFAGSASPDEQKAFYWMNEASARGYSLARWYLGDMYLTATSPQYRNPDKAWTLLEDAAKRGEFSATNQLANLLISRDGPGDLERAGRLLDEAERLHGLHTQAFEYEMRSQVLKNYMAATNRTRVVTRMVISNDGTPAPTTSSGPYNGKALPDIGHHQYCEVFGTSGGCR